DEEHDQDAHDDPRRRASAASIRNDDFLVFAIHGVLRFFSSQGDGTAVGKLTLMFVPGPGLVPGPKPNHQITTRIRITIRIPAMSPADTPPPPSLLTTTCSSLTETCSSSCIDSSR